MTHSPMDLRDDLVDRAAIAITFIEDLAKALTEANARADRLEAELQAHKEWLKSRDEQIQRNYLKALDDGDRITALEAALKPFAGVLSDWKKLFHDYPPDTSQIMVKVIDLKNARAALASRETQPQL